MIRALAAAGALLALLPVAGCVSWQDKAGTDALVACEKKVDPEERRLCREMVIAAAKGEHQKQIDRMQESIREAEERERLRQVYGGPGQVDR
ncbi:MAG: hypothetical protein CVT79_14825 [Alphaproteobacteria bacterium HGW-Alphaproteobacteria-18]|nr:MAG: hypothetical protein CVT79_14825 [Alphaproteobacteria bacterium HGW-Alphaproteobacteria-18]